MYNASYRRWSLPRDLSTIDIFKWSYSNAILAATGHKPSAIYGMVTAFLAPSFYGRALEEVLSRHKEHGHVSLALSRYAEGIILFPFTLMLYGIFRHRKYKKLDALLI